MGYLTVLYYGIRYPEECDTLWNMESLMQPAERDESNLPNLHLRASKTKPEHVLRKWYTSFPCPAEHIDRKTQIMNGFNDNLWHLWPQIKIDHFVGQRNGFNCLGCRFDNKSKEIHRGNIQELSQALAELVCLTPPIPQEMQQKPSQKPSQNASIWTIPPIPRGFCRPDTQWLQQGLQGGWLMLQWGPPQKGGHSHPPTHLAGEICGGCTTSPRRSSLAYVANVRYISQWIQCPYIMLWWIIINWIKLFASYSPYIIHHSYYVNSPFCLHLHPSLIHNEH